MGYACPVCETPQQDAEHLANHLAFTAMLENDEHEEWLDEHAPGWDQAGPDELAPRVAEHAEEAEYQQVFEDTVHQHTGHDSLFDEGHGHSHGGQSSIDPDAAQQRGGGALDGGALDAEAQQILDEAQQMTQEMFQDGADAEGESDGDTDAEGKES